MTRDSDEDALRWEGDDDPTLAPGWKTVGNPATPTEPNAPASAGDGNAAASDSSTQSSTGRAEAVSPTGSVELVVLGVLGGVYLLYAVGWIIVATRLSNGSVDPVAQFMFGLGGWLAVLAVPLWFGITLWLSAGRSRVRILWLVAGAIVLAPLPFLLGTGVAA